MYDIKRTWPKWEIVRTIGEGSFGKVFEISRKEFGIEEHCALKVISIPQSDGEVQSLKNDGMTESDTSEYFKGIVSDFVQEIQLMSQLKGNSNIVAYEDFAVVEKTDSIGYEILIRMELLTGLPNYLRANRFRVFDVIQLGIEMCKALETCRELNIVHRDIKPDNIFVSSGGHYKLGDFGVARTIEKTMAGLSRKGTYSYMAPEIYNGNEYGFEADIYSLGIVLYKLLNNNRDPFLPAYPAPVKYSDKTEAMVKRIQGVPMPKPVNADDRLANIIFKACAHDPTKRFQHPKDLRVELEAVASVYFELQSEVFSENGINYYTNNSTFSVVDKSVVSVPADEAKSVAGTGGNDCFPLSGEPAHEKKSMIGAENRAHGEPAVQKAEDDRPSQPPVAVRRSTAAPKTATTEPQVAAAAQRAATPQKPAMTQAPGRPQPSGTVQRTVAPQTAAAPQSPRMTLRCPSCRYLIKAGDTFCGHCGHRIPAAPKAAFCSRCGFALKPGAKFCGKCGTKL